MKEQEKEHVKEAAGDAGNDEEAKLVDEMKKELRADKVQLDEGPTEAKEWK